MSEPADDRIDRMICSCHYSNDRGNGERQRGPARLPMLRSRRVTGRERGAGQAVRRSSAVSVRCSHRDRGVQAWMKPFTNAAGLQRLPAADPDRSRRGGGGAMVKSFIPHADTRGSAGGQELVGGCLRTHKASGGRGRTDEELSLECNCERSQSRLENRPQLVANPGEERIRQLPDRTAPCQLVGNKKQRGSQPSRRPCRRAVLYDYSRPKVYSQITAPSQPGTNGGGS